MASIVATGSYYVKSFWKNRKSFLAGGVGEAVVQGHEREICWALYARGQEGGELQCVRGPQRVDAQEPIGSRADRLRREDGHGGLIEAKQPLRGGRELSGVQLTGSLSPVKA